MSRLGAAVALAVALLVSSCGGGTTTPSGGIPGTSDSPPLTAAEYSPAGNGLPIPLERVMQAMADALNYEIADPALPTDVRRSNCRQAATTLSAGTVTIERDTQAAGGSRWYPAYLLAEKAVKDMNKYLSQCVAAGIDGTAPSWGLWSASIEAFIDEVDTQQR